MSVQAARQTDAVGSATDAGLIAARRAVSIALGLLLVLLMVDLAKAAHIAAFAIGYPYQLDYGEGIVWQQMINIVAGRGYAPIGVFPAIVYHYPPCLPSYDRWARDAVADGSTRRRPPRVADIDDRNAGARCGACGVCSAARRDARGARLRRGFCPR